MSWLNKGFPLWREQDSQSWHVQWLPLTLQEVLVPGKLVRVFALDHTQVQHKFCHQYLCSKLQTAHQHWRCTAESNW